MSAKETPTLTTLPVELIYEILHHLDVRDIALSFRYVCSDFYYITNSYNRYKISIQSTSPESEVRRLSRVIQPESIVSLGLYRKTRIPDRTALFLSLIRLDELTRLSSLELYGADESYLRLFTPHIDHYGRLKRLSVTTALLERDEDNAATAEQLTILMTGRSLQQVFLGKLDQSVVQRLASRQYHFHTLEIHECTHETIVPLLPHLSNVRVFSCREYSITAEQPVDFLPPMLPFTSLTLKMPELIVDRIERFLMRTPALNRLRLSGCCDLAFLEHLTSKWERLIRRHLKSLKHFQFFFTCSSVNYKIVPRLERILNQFRTRFWTEEMGCSVTCRYICNEARSDLLFYSPADSSPKFPDNLCSGTLSYTTTISDIQDRDNPDCRWSARFNLAEIEQAISTNQVCLSRRNFLEICCWFF